MPTGITLKNSPVVYISAWFSRVEVLFVGFALFFAGVMVWAQAGHIDSDTLPDTLLSVRLMPHMLGLYVLGATLYMFFALRRAEWLAKVGGMFVLLASALAASLVLTATWESYQVLEQGHVAVTNLYEVSILLLAVIGIISQYLERATQRHALGVFTAPILIAGGFFVLWLADIGQAGPRHLMPALQSYWLPWHVLANFIGYGCFGVAGAAGVMQLLRARLDRQGKITQFLPPAGGCGADNF
jgi:ABC-type transport system involved in cytochrome c biogenesis permease subunit